MDLEAYLDARNAAREMGLRVVDAADDLSHAASLIRAAAASLRDLRATDHGRWHAASPDDQAAVEEVTRLLLDEAVRLVIEAADQAMRAI